MNGILKIALLAIFFTGAGCAHSIHQVQVSDFSPYAPKTKGRTIKVKTEQFVILGFTGDVDYVEKALTKLLAKCPKGQIVGITTEYMTNLGFFSYTNKIFMKGLCV
jgi:hypothetical protein